MIGCEVFGLEDSDESSIIPKITHVLMRLIIYAHDLSVPVVPIGCFANYPRLEDEGEADVRDKDQTFS